MDVEPSALVSPRVPETLEEFRKALEDWEHAFDDERGDGGAFAGFDGRITPAAVLHELQRCRAAEQEASALRQRLAASAAEAAWYARNDVALRDELHSARAIGEPSVLQLRQLLIEPAVNREFARLEASTAAAHREVAVLKEEMRAIHMVATDPKGPRVLAAQIKTLEDRCEALTAGASDSRASQLETTLALAQSQLEAMRRQYGELEDHAHSLDDEAEALQRELMALRRASGMPSGTLPQPSGAPRALGGGGGGGPPDLRGMDDRHRRGHFAGPPPPGGWGRGRGIPMRPPLHFQAHGGRGPPAMPYGAKRPRDY